MASKDLPATINEVRQLATTEPDRFWSPQMRSHHARLIEQEQSPHGKVIAIVDALAEALDPRHWGAFESTFDQLPETVQAAAGQELAAGPVMWAEPATYDEMVRFRKQVAGGSELLAEWNTEREAKVGQFFSRLNRFAGGLDDDDYYAFAGWFEHLPAEDMKILIKALVG